MEIFIVLIVGLLFAWLASIFIEGHGLGYALNLLVATVGSLVGLIIYQNVSIPPNHFWGEFFASAFSSIVFLIPVTIYSTKRKVS